MVSYITGTSLGKVIEMSRSNSSVEDAIQAAARALHQAELALHDARSSGVDAWVAAAGDRLHDAVERYLARCSVTIWEVA